MDPHSRAFTFVDRIVSFEPASRIVGRYSIPAEIAEFPQSLISEAIGQLAALAAMSAVDFKSRPVAGLAERVELLGTAQPGQTLELSAELASVDGEAVSYSGAAFVDGLPVVRLHHCVGPMVPMAEFADPEVVRAAFEASFQAPGLTGGFTGLPSLLIAPEIIEPGRCHRARWTVPASAPFFADHFPRRPVFPGSLLMHLKLQLAASLASVLPSPDKRGHWTVRSVNDVKLRAFIPPGESLDLEATLKRYSADATTIFVQSRNNSRIIGGARIELTPELIP